MCAADACQWMMPMSDPLPVRVSSESGFSTIPRFKLPTYLKLFRPPTVSVATRTLTSGARRNPKGNGSRARDAGRSCRCLPALVPTLVLGRPSLR